MPTPAARTATRSGEGEATPPKPQPLRPDFERIPDELRKHARWVLWRLELKRDAKPDDLKPWTKVPLRSDGRGHAASNRPETWATFEATRAAFERGTKGADGVGFVTGEGIVGGDVDGCRDLSTGELTPEAAAIVAQVNTYAEVSPSGEGIRFWATTDADPGKGKRRGAVEIYPSGQYLTVTGHQLAGTPDTIEHRPAELAAIHAEHIAQPPRPSSNGEHHGPVPIGAGSGAHLADTDVLERMKGAKPAAAALYDGDTSAHSGDHSAADLALCSHLAWWTDYDAAQVDRLFRASGLMRPKWDRKVSSDGELYGERTIRTAFEGNGPGHGYRPPIADAAPAGRDPSDPGPTDDDAPPDLLLPEIHSSPPEAPATSSRPKATKPAPKPKAPPKGPRVREVAPLVTLGELQGMTFAPLASVIEDAVLPGLNVLAGKPKLGKSWLALLMCLRVAAGESLWNRRTTKGRAIYYGLEDSHRRLHSRLAKLGDEALAAAARDDLHLGIDLPRLDAGGIDHLRDVLTRYPDTRLVVLDTLARVMPTGASKGTAYDTSSILGADLQAIAKEHDVALLVVTHLRKAGGEDILDLVSGGLGLAASADSVLVLQRKRGEADATLTVTGRDLGEREDALRFDPHTGTWHMLGPAADYTGSKQRRLILEAVRELQATGSSTGPAAVADHIGDEVKPNTVRQLMPRMVREGLLTAKGRGEYSDPHAPVANVAFVAKPLPYREG